MATEVGSQGKVCKSKDGGRYRCSSIRYMQDSQIYPWTGRVCALSQMPTFKQRQRRNISKEINGWSSTSLQLPQKTHCWWSGVPEFAIAGKANRDVNPTSVTSDWGRVVHLGGKNIQGNFWFHLRVFIFTADMLESSWDWFKWSGKRQKPMKMRSEC